MSTDDRKRRRIEGHPGIYQRGGSFQVRHRDGESGKVVTRSFPTLARAVAYKARRDDGVSDPFALGATDQLVGKEPRTFERLADALLYEMAGWWSLADDHDLGDVMQAMSRAVEQLANLLEDVENRLAALEAKR